MTTKKELIQALADLGVTNPVEMHLDHAAQAARELLGTSTYFTERQSTGAAVAAYFASAATYDPEAPHPAEPCCVTDYYAPLRLSEYAAKWAARDAAKAVRARVASAHDIRDACVSVGYAREYDVDVDELREECLQAGMMFYERTPDVKTVVSCVTTIIEKHEVACSVGDMYLV